MKVPSNKKALCNATFDTGWLFEIGNTFIAAPNIPAMLFSITVASIAYAARYVGELKSDNADVPKGLNWLPKNLGTSLIISGTGLISSSIVKGVTEGFNFTVSPQASHPIEASGAAILLLFGIANISRGIARGVSQGGMSQKTLDTIGIILATAGVMASVPDSSMAAKALLISAAAIETLSSLTPKKIPSGLADYTFASACGINGVNAAMSGSTLAGAANFIFALAFISLGALKRNGGFYQMIKSNLQLN